jgi:hypothetical protein
VSDSHPFVSRKAQLIFYLTVMDGKQRCDLLGITEEHYCDANLAGEWYIGLMRELGLENDENRAAIRKLKDLYAVMTRVY